MARGPRDPRGGRDGLRRCFRLIAESPVEGLGDAALAPDRRLKGRARLIGRQAGGAVRGAVEIGP